MDRFLIEVSFEAGNKVGGIWTVLTSKSSYMKKQFGDNYLAVGFYNPNQAAVEFLESPPPQFIKDAMSDIKLDGIKVYFGKWSSANDVNILLIDAKEFENKHVNEVKKDFWDNFKIDSLNSPDDYNEPLAWSYAAGAVIEALSKTIKSSIVVQAHEWLSAGAVLYLKYKKVKIPTVFTIHATVLGRAISYSGGNTNTYVISNTGITTDMPYKYGIAAKHFTEKAGAFNATIFTAVSRVVAKEAEVILGKKVDFVTINGIDTDNLPATDELSAMRVNAKKKLNNFLNAYFLPYYDLNPNNLRVFVTSGRYEFYDKGYDVFIDALGKLDKMLADDNYVIALIAVPSGTVGVRNDVVANYLTYMSIKSALDEDLKNFDSVVSSSVEMEEQNTDRAYSKMINDSKRLLKQLRRPKPTNPPLTPFMLSYPEYNDAILNKLHENGLENSAQNHVKVVFYPKYLAVGDELLNLTYYEMLALSTAGFFLSKYEPFGYTPLEAAAYMSISFTSDYSGFGQYLLNDYKDGYKGVFVERMLGKKRDDCTVQIAKDMMKIALMNEDDLLKLKISANELASQFGWEKFLPVYLQAYDAALRKI
ncbi:MAG: glycogen/starch synthase [Candidatus Parvarchaeota archaeon]|jgi:glycosyltransferase involved in cell wall biosynthesis|nr:glycogen/starch synthase [Candidatus Parvarchaeota archaeon]MCL5420482.1 glycogen/starch synthase [Candidatus Parvarchaeota archaeon]